MQSCKTWVRIPHAPLLLEYGVMVAQRFLEPFVVVQIRLFQLWVLSYTTQTSLSVERQYNVRGAATSKRSNRLDGMYLSV